MSIPRDKSDTPPHIQRISIDNSERNTNTNRNSNSKMPKSLFTFFNNNKFGRKLAYIAHPPQKSAKESSTVSESVGSSFRDKVIQPQKARKCEKFLDGGIWMLASVIATITSLLAYDFTIAFLPKDVDISTDIILLIVFWFFFIELIVASLVRRGYFLSFWFWLDFIAMVSMIPDLTLLLALFGANDGDINIANTQASKAGKSGRSAVALKAIRMIRFSRLLRVLRVFKFFQAEEEEDVKQNVADAGSSKVGQIVSEAVTKKVIVLVLVLVLPWMDPSGASYGEAAETCSYLFKQCIDNNINFEQSLQIFENVGVPLLYINIGNNILLNDATTISDRRDIEMWTLQLDNNDIIKFDIRSNVLEEAALGMCLTLFAILIFAFSTLFVTASTMSLVVQPIARLTELLMRMAGVIGLLGGAQTVENLMEDKDELFIVEALCERIMDIFGGGNQSNYDSSSNKGSKKALSMMASRKVTQITSGDRVWEIDVKEKHRTSVIERRVKRSFVDFVKSEARETSIDEDGFSELKSLQSIVDNPITLYCLRMFMTSNLTINNLLFILEAQEWKQQQKKKFHGLYNRYCDDRSPAQINLNADMFEKIAKVANSEVPLNDNVFEEAINETWSLMEVNVFKQFLKSDHCKFYVHMKQNDPVTLNQLQLSVPDNITGANVQKEVIRSSEKQFPEYFSTER
eukprot:160391_1